MFSKGMSPIIATVLLIAFAVSLGVVIMNISVTATVSACNDVSLSVFSIGGSNRICFDSATQEIKFTLVNEGVPIEGLKISAVGVSSDEVEVNQPLTTQSNFVYVLSVSDKRNNVLTVIPKVLENGKIEYCSDQGLLIERIPAC